MSMTCTHPLSCEVSHFFAENPIRRYFVKVIQTDLTSEFCKLFIVPNEPFVDYGVAVDWHIEKGERRPIELAKWFNSDPYAEILIEALLLECGRPPASVRQGPHYEGDFRVLDSASTR
ncbi:hypothetical protein [Burkholderia sp. PAMC 28687]|uniref:hypothetical protein n=1 Tax=Burkholderia sp. PAMC 28687 TaxID=1795874 RepID=UPI000AB46715|nr:hypothetical protein [Burkholderia sp. PAMC 28687]